MEKAQFIARAAVVYRDKGGLSESDAQDAAAECWHVRKYEYADHEMQPPHDADYTPEAMAMDCIEEWKYC